MQAPPPHDSEALHKARLDYVQRCFQNVHELNRMMDQKANFLLAAVALITGALAVIATAPLNRKTPEDWQVYLRIAAFVFLLIYLFVAFRVIVVTTQVFRAIGTMVSPNTRAPGLLFPLMIMERYANEDAYRNKSSSLTYDDIFEDYSNQIIEVSNIYSYKQKVMSQAMDAFHVLVWLWLATICLEALTAFLLPT